MNKIETLIRECANSNENSIHADVCRQIVAFMQSHPTAPFTFVIACACQKDAHKTKAFEKGYKKFDGAKVETIMAMLSLYYAYNNNNKKPSDVAWRLIMRYYETISTDINDFKSALSKSKKYGKRCGSRDIKYSELCANLGMVFYDYVKDDGLTLEEMNKKSA